ncbi:MAG: L,D-transpeptidase, partial [Planctomycetota bacterium]
VQCWTLETPGPLEEYIKTGAGAQLSAGRRQLVASFWRACMGDADGAAAQLDRLAGEAGVTSEQLELLRLALGRAGARALPASASARDPLSRAMRMVLATEEGRVALERNDHARAANAYSDAILLELGAPWAPQRDALLAWGASLDRAQRMHRLSPSGQWPSVDYVVKPDDYLIGIRKRVIAADSRLLLCVGLMEAVNGIKDGRITPGVTLRFPIDQANVLVDLDARVAVFRLGSEVVKLWPVGIGREGHDTPVGSYVVGEKLENPSHMPQGGAALPYGHPDNPLGTRWIAWNKDGRSTSIGFHGTSKPDGVGERVSLGCIRMRNEDVEELFELLPRDARIVVQP